MSTGAVELYFVPFAFLNVIQLTTVSVVVEPPQTVSTPAGEEAFLGASEAITSRSRDDEASMACGFLRCIIIESMSTLHQA